MSDIGVTLIWCAAQVAALGVVTAILFRVSRRVAPLAAPLISFSSLVVVILLAGASFGPVPSYFDLFPLQEFLVEQGVLTKTTPEAANTAPTTASMRPATTLLADMVRHTCDELSRAGSHSLIANWPWPSVVSLLFVFGTGVGLLQLLVGLIAVHSHRRRSCPVNDRRMLALVEQLRREMDCGRDVEIGVSYDLTTAATVGWLRPLILLPANWRQWSAEERRAVVAHELAHIRHNDYLAVVMAQIGVALHFYHPVVHWLSGRMRLEQEIAADAAAARVAGGQQQYLTSLASMALRQSDGPRAWLSRAFLPTRGALMTRIDMLRDSRGLPAKLSSGAQTLTILIVVVSGILVAGLRSPEASADSSGPVGVTTCGSPDLSLIPDETAGMVVIRPAAIARTPGLQAAASRFNATAMGELGAPLEEIEQITWVAPRVSTQRPLVTAAAPLPPFGILIIQATHPRKFTELIERFAPNAEERQWGEARYHVSRDKGVAYHRPTEQSIVLMSERDVVRYLTLPRGEPTLAQHPDWKESERLPLAFAVDVRWVRQLMENARVMGGRGDFAALAPIWRLSDYASGGMRVSRTLQLQLTASCFDQESAQRVKDTLHAATILARNLVEGNSLAAKRSPEEGPRLNPMSGLVARITNQFLANVRVRCQGLKVSGASHSRWSPSSLYTALKEVGTDRKEK